MLLTPTNMKRSIAREGGFLLIEMLVVMLILAIGLLGIIAESSAAVRGGRLANQGTAGTALGQAKIEELKGVRFDDIASGADATTLDANGAANGVFSRSWSVTSQTLNGVPAKQITVTVTWPETTGTPSVSLTTLIVNVPDFGPNLPTVVQRSWRRA